MFKPQKIYYEPQIENYELGKELLKKYEDTPKVQIQSHNNIEEMQKNSNREFLNMKNLLNFAKRKYSILFRKQ